MKKIALLLLMIFVCVAALAACNSTPATKRDVRWIEGESHTFKVSLADFAFYPPDDTTPLSERTVFKTYTSGAYVNSEGTSIRFGKDIGISNEVFSSLDEIRPRAVDGTYRMDLAKTQSERMTLTTEQTLYVQYNKISKSQSGDDIDLTQSANWGELAKLIPAADEIAANAPSLQPSDDSVVLKSVIKNSVTFADQAMTPYNSSTESNGFYIGVSEQSPSRYKVQTTYDFSEKRPTATVQVDENEPVTYTMGKNAQFFDYNQLLLYIRSFNKSSSDFQDVPSVQLFNPLSGELVSASFGFLYSQPMVLTDNNRATPELYANVNLVSVALGGMAYMVQENVPDTAKLNGKLVDIVPGEVDANGADKCRYTTVRFRVGYLSYELASYSDELWSALEYNNAKPQ